MTNITPFAIWSGEEVYQGKSCENLTNEEAELKKMFEWAKKELNNDGNADSNNNNDTNDSCNNTTRTMMMDVDS